MVTETVSLDGHIVDSLTLSKVLDLILLHGGSYKISRFRIGETRSDMSHAEIAVDAETRKILGAAILGTSGDEAVQCITATMAAGVPYTTLQRTVLMHPTVSELIPTLLGSLVPLAG